MLSQAQLQRFKRDGFLAIEGLLSDEDLEPITEEYDDLLDAHLRRLVAEGLLPTSPRGGFSERFSAALAADPDLHRYFNISLPLINGAVDASTYVMHAGSAVFDLLRQPKILDVVESVIGPEIMSNPVQQMRIKPAESAVGDDALLMHSNVGVATWHQDIVALLPESDDTPILTVWIALTDASLENGCLVSLKGSHRFGAQVHCENAELASEPTVPPHLLKDMREIALPVKRGGVVLFDKHNVHRSLPNRSESLRWSMDIRYNPIGMATGRPAFPGFVARSRNDPASVLDSAATWQRLWNDARDNILAGRHGGRLFSDRRFHDEAVC